MENKPIEQMNSDELSNLLVEKEKEYQKQSDVYNTWNIEKMRLEKEIALLRIKHNEARSTLAMADNNCKRTKSELRMIERLYWKSRGK